MELRRPSADVDVEIFGGGLLGVGGVDVFDRDSDAVSSADFEGTPSFHRHGARVPVYVESVEGVGWREGRGSRRKKKKKKRGWMRKKRRGEEDEKEGLKEEK